MDAYSSIGPLVQSRGPLYGLAAGWGLVLVVGLALQASYDARPGDEIPPPRYWPAASQLLRSAARPSVLVFVHPRCPCTAATLAELRQFLDATRVPVDITIVLPQPEQASASFCDAPRVRLQAVWPEAQVVVDRCGAETRLFQSTTSGHLLVYDPEGRLRFSGGITIARGHRGENPGLRSFAAALRSLQEQTPTIATFPVFGCALLDAAKEES